MKKIIYISGILGIIAMAVVITIMYRSILDISIISKTEDSEWEEKTFVEQKEKKIVYFGVISRFSPRQIYEGYHPVMEYLSKETPYHFQLRLSDSYNETIKQVHEGKVTFAFVGTHIYVKARKRYNVICILKPLNRQGEPYFRSALITRKDNPAASFNNLRGMRIAVPSKASFSANWLVYDAMPKNNIQIQDLDTLHFFNYHHTVIYEILKNKFDAGVVKDRVAAEFANRDIKVLAYSHPIPGSPIVMNKDTDSLLVQEVTEALLRIDPSREKYLNLTKTWDREFVYGFQSAKDSDYNHIDSLITAFGD